MSKSKADNNVRLLLVGKSGEGKSSTGNSILGQKRFKSVASFEQTPGACQEEEASVEGRDVVVVDTPGLTAQDIRSSNLKSFTSMAEQGIPLAFDAMLIIIRCASRLTEEDGTVFQYLEELFGKDCIREYGILVVTNVDNYDPKIYKDMPVEKFLQNQTGLFKDMREKCNNRLLLFDNKTKDDSTNQAQVNNLLEMVTKMREQSGRYTRNAFEQPLESSDRAKSMHKLERRASSLDTDTRTQATHIRHRCRTASSSSQGTENFAQAVAKSMSDKMYRVIQDVMLGEQDRATNSFPQVTIKKWRDLAHAIALSESDRMSNIVYEAVMQELAVDRNPIG